MSVCIKNLLFYFLISVFASASFSQNYGGTIYSGMGISDFENQQESGYSIPLGIYLSYSISDNFEIGLGANTSVRDFKIEDKEHPYTLPNNDKVLASGTATFSQNIFSLYFKYKFIETFMNPYVKVEGGLFTGDGKLKGSYHYEGSDYLKEGTLSFDLKKSFGYSIGFGAIPFSRNSNALTIELIYHIVRREPDLADSQDEGGNNFAIHLGYSFKIKMR